MVDGHVTCGGGGGGVVINNSDQNYIDPFSSYIYLQCIMMGP